MPEAEFASLLQGYVRELEQYMSDHKTDSDTDIPDWAHRLMKER